MNIIDQLLVNGDRQVLLVAGHDLEIQASGAKLRALVEEMPPDPTDALIEKDPRPFAMVHVGNDCPLLPAISYGTVFVDRSGKRTLTVNTREEYVTETVFRCSLARYT